ncbi:MAG: TonB-dependent receptor [Lacibacter sp.]
MKQLSIIIFFFFYFINCTSIAAAQQLNQYSIQSNILPEKAALSGKITDGKTGEALAGATVFFPDLRIGGTSDEHGYYSIQNIAEGKYLVEISYTGYSTILETILLKGIVKRDFALTPSFTEHEGVTVTGVSNATSVKKSPVPVELIKRSDLMKGVSTNVIDALSKIPGVNQVSTGPAISKPVIRGLGYNRVIVMNDGIRQEGQQWGDEHGIEVDEFSVSKIEILKGPASLMYGSDALAGVINILSIHPSAEGSAGGNVVTGFQTNNRQHFIHANADGNNNGFIWGVHATYKAAVDYRNKYDGAVYNSRFKENSAGAYLGLNKHWGFSRIYYSRFDQHPGIIEGERDNATGKFLKLVNENGSEAEVLVDDSDAKSVNPGFPYQRILHSKIATENSFNFKSGRLVFTAGFQQNQREEFGNVLDPQERELHFDLRTINYNLQYHFDEIKGWKTSAGMNGMQQQNINKGEEVLIPAYNLFDAGMFVYTQKAFGKTTFSGGIRFDNRSLHSEALEENGNLKFSAFKKQFSNFSASAGVSSEVSDKVVLKLNVARGFRAPNLSELASNGAHEGTNRYELGEQDLHSETSFQTDATFDYTSTHVSFTANLFYNSVQHFIYYSKLSSAGGGDSLLVDGSDVLTVFKYDQNAARLYGFEMKVDIHPHPLHWLHIENMFSYVRGMLSVEKDGSKNLPFIPAPRLLTEVRGEFLPKGKTIRNFFVQLEADNTFAQNHPFTGYDTETRTGAYCLLNVSVGADIVRKSKTLFSVYLAGNNLSDVAWQSHLSRLKYTAENMVTGRAGVFNMGRNFSIKVNVPLKFN